jgi:hypothetical protein
MKNYFIFLLKIILICLVLTVPLFVMYIFSLYIAHDFHPDSLAIDKCEQMKRIWDYEKNICK